MRTHLEFGFQHPSALKVINRDHELLPEPQRGEIARKRGAYVQRGLGLLRDLDPRARAEGELVSATTLLLGMLNGIATRPFVRGNEDARRLAAEVGALFLYGFLEPASAGPVPALLEVTHGDR